MFLNKRFGAVREPMQSYRHVVACMCTCDYTLVDINKTGVEMKVEFNF